MKIGVAYYPEQWPRDHWQTDARKMAEFGVDVVRVGDSAWSRLEPRRERIEMDWLEDSIRILAAEGLKIILCTPTASPPPWLFNRHKSILPTQYDGTQWYYGSRRHVCLNNPAYRKYVRRIVTELSRKFGHNPNVFAWQVDHDLFGGKTGLCFCDECEQAFRRWLKRRYGTIERLNKLWGTAFWSQEFVDWHEIPVPRKTPGNPHPSLLLDYRRFASAQVRAFIKHQRDIINEFSGEGAIVTANEPWPVPHLNSVAIGEVLDVVSVDNYPCQTDRTAETILRLDFTRSIKHKPFWVMEQQGGATLLRGASAQPRPGQLRLWSYQAAARGAELLCYFRWRTAGAGQQMFWDGIIDSDGVPRRRYDEIKNTVSELKKHHSMWDGQLPVSKAAIFLDHESCWALDSADLGSDPDCFAQMSGFHDCLRRRGITADFVSEKDDLASYDLVIVPMPFFASSNAVGNLELFTRRGGTVLVTAPAGCASGVAATGSMRAPGPLLPLLGLEVKECDNLTSENSSVEFEDGSTFPAVSRCCLTELRGARPLARYGEGFYADAPALTLCEVESGHAMFLATCLDKPGLDKVLDLALKTADSDPAPWATEGGDIEIVELETGDSSVRKIFVFNHSKDKSFLKFNNDLSGTELLSDTPLDGGIELEGYQPALIELT